MTTNAELRALAEKATPGPWKSVDDGDGYFAVETEDGKWNIIGELGTPAHKNTAYIAAAHPARIIELLDDLEVSQGGHLLAQSMLTDTRAQLDLAVRALASILGETERGIVHNIARHALAQLKEQP